MSTTIDERIVKMQFDNSGFEAGANKAIGILDKLKTSLRLDGASEGLDTAQNKVRNFDMSAMIQSVSQTTEHFGFLERTAYNALNRISNKVLDLGTNILQNLTVKPLMDGFGEYQTQIGSVQTILSNAGDQLEKDGYDTEEKKIEVINECLDDLNEYADKTIYNFTEMTKNIGTFTAAGVDLDTATTAIQGIANLAAASGSSSQQASTAMYQLSQAISTGALKLQDWNSVVNAGMGGQLFQNALERTARHHGIAVDEMIEKNGSFRESLKEGWITSDILTETLEQLTYSYDKVGDEAYNAGMNRLLESGYTKEEAEEILKLAKNAQDAATKVRTWNQLWDTVGESLGSGWATTWRTIVGDFTEATDLFTHLSDAITGVINDSSDARNALLQQWADAGGRTALVDGIKYVVDTIESVVRIFGRAFSEVFGISAEQIYNLSTGFAVFAEKMANSTAVFDFLYDALFNVFTIIHSVFGIAGNLVRIVIDGVSAVAPLVLPFLGAVVVGLGQALEVIARWAARFHLYSDMLEDIFGTVQMSIQPVTDAVGRFITAAMNGLKTLVSPLNKLVSAFAHGADKLLAFFLYGRQAVEEFDKAKGAATRFGGALGFLSTCLSTVSGYAAKAIDFLTGLFTTLTGSLAGGITSVAEKIPGVVSSIIDAISGTVKDLLSTNKIAKEFDKTTKNVSDTVSKFGDSWSETFAKLLEWLDKFISGAISKISTISDKFAAFRQIITNVAEDVIAVFKGDVARFSSRKNSGDLQESVKNISEEFSGLRTLISDKIPKAFEVFRSSSITAFSKFAETAKQDVENVKTLFLNAWDTIKKNAFNYGSLFMTGVLDVKQMATDFVTGMLGHIPNVAEVVGGFATFFLDVGKGIKDGLATAFPDGIYLSTLVNPLLEFFDFENIEIKWPDWKTPLNNLIDDISNEIEYASDRLSESIDVEDILTKALTGSRIYRVIQSGNLLGGIGTAFGGFGKMLKGFGKGASEAGEGVGKGLEKLPDAISKFSQMFGKGAAKEIGGGMSEIGKGLGNFAKAFKSDSTKSFVRIAEGILILSGALYVLSKLPIHKMEGLLPVLAKLAGGLVAFVAALALVNRFLAVGFIEEIGSSIMKLGIGVAAIAAAVWILADIPSDKLAGGLGSMIIICVSVASVLAAIGHTDIKGAGATLVALGIAINLMALPIVAFGWLWNHHGKLLRRGVIMTTLLMAVIGGFMSLMSFVVTNGKDMALASIPILALAGAITLLTVPIAILGTLKGAAWSGLGVVSILAAVLSGCVWALSQVVYSGKDVALASLALVSLSAALILVSGIVIILGAVSDIAAKGANSVFWISLILTGTIAILTQISKEKSAIIRTTVAMILLSVAIDLVGAIVILLGAVGEVASRGVRALAGISACMALLMLVCYEFAGNTKQLAGAVVVMGTMAIVVGIMGAIVISLGAFGDVARTGLYALAGVSACMALLMLVCYEFAGNTAELFKTMAAMGTMVVVIGAMGLVIAAISQLASANLEAVEKSVDAIVKVGIVLGILVGVASIAKGGLIVFAGSLLAISASLVIFAHALSTLMTVDWDHIADGWNRLWGAFASSSGGQVIIGFFNGIFDLLSLIEQVGGLIYHALVDPIREWLGINSPSVVMAELGEFSVEGFFNGLMENLGLVDEGSGEISTTFLENFDNLPSLLGEKAGEGVDAFLSGIDLESITAKGLDVVNSFIAGIDTDVVVAKITEVANGLIASLSASLDENMPALGSGGILSFALGIAAKALLPKNEVDNAVSLASIAANALGINLEQKGKDGGEMMAQGIESKASRVQGAVVSITTAAGNFSSVDLYNNMYDAGAYAGEGLARGIESKTTRVKTAAGSLASVAVRNTKATMEVASPSKVMFRVGGFAGEGLALGILDKVSRVASVSKEMGSAVPEGFESGLTSMSVDIDDLLDTDYNPVITPVIDSTTFDSNLRSLSSMLNSRLNDNIQIGNVNYNEEFAGKLDAVADVNRQTMQQLASSAIDYNLLGASVANALIRSGVHVEMDGGQLVGYLAGEIKDARRMYS